MSAREQAGTAAGPVKPWRRRLDLAFWALVLLAAFFSQTPRLLNGPESWLVRLVLDIPYIFLFGMLGSRLGDRPQPQSRPPSDLLGASTMAGCAVDFAFRLWFFLEESWRPGAGGSSIWFRPSEAAREALPDALWAQYLSPRVLAWALATAALATLLLRYERLRAAAAQEVALRREAQDLALRARLAPHFIFNALNTLTAQIELDPRGAASTADRLAALLRQVLERADRATVPLREELEFVEAYLGIERDRLGHRLQVSVEVPEEAEGFLVPPMSLQALVENAVVHGIAPREKGGDLRISAVLGEEGSLPTVRLTVENPVARGGRQGTGTGLKALRGRLLHPEDLRLEQRDGRFLAEFVWRGVAA